MEGHAEQQELFPQLDPLEAERTFEVEFRACRELLALAWDRKPTGRGMKNAVVADEPQWRWSMCVEPIVLSTGGPN